MHNITTNPDIRAILEQAHAERNQAIRSFFVAIFSRKGRPAQVAAQAA